MNNFAPLLQKELIEYHRKFKILLIFSVFAIIGLLSPVIAKILPELLKSVGDESMGFKLFFTREPGIEDALLQYHKNLALFPILLCLLTMGCISGERQKQITPLLFSKPIDPVSYVLSKFITPALVCALGQLVAAVAFVMYSLVIFKEYGGRTFLDVNLYINLYFTFFIALTVYLSSFLSTTATAVVSISVYGILSMVAALPKLSWLTPQGLTTASFSEIQHIPVKNISITISITSALIIFLVVHTCRKVKRTDF